MTDLAKLVVKLEANSSKLVKELDKSNKRAEKWEKQVKFSIGNVKKAFAGLGVAVAGVAFANFVKESIAAADATAKNADALALSTDAYQKLSFVAGQAGVNQSQFTSNMTAFVKRVGEARSGVGPLVSFLRQYDERLLTNIQNTTTQEQALNLVADAIKNAATATDQAAIANAAFSRAGVNMTNMLRGGSVALEAYKDKAEELGLVIDEQLLRNAEETNNQIDILGQTIKVQATAAVVQYSGEIQTLVGVLLDWMKTAARAVDFAKWLGESFAAMVHGPSDPVRVGERVDELRKKIGMLSQGIINRQSQLSGGKGWVQRWMAGETNDSDFDQIRQLGEELNNLILTQDRFAQAAANAPALPNLGGNNLDAKQAQNQAEKEQAIAHNYEMFELEMARLDEQEAYQAEWRDNYLNAQLEMYMAEERAVEQLAEQRLRSEKMVNDKITQMRFNAAQLAIGFLRQVAGENKTVAKLIIAAEKGLAMAQVFVQTQVAAMRARAELGPVAGETAAQRINLLGKISMGLIAATGVAQAAGIGGGGGGGGLPPGTVANPVVTTDADQGAGTAANQPQNQSTFIVIGMEPDDATLDRILDRAEQAFNEGSRVIIRRDSPQALEIAAAAT